MSPRLVCSVWFSLLFVGVGSVYAETPATLMKWVPADANAVAIVDVEALFRTPLAMRENLRQKMADAFVNHELSVPPESKRVVFASQLGLSSQLQPEWEAGVIELARTPSFAVIARREGGQLDTLAGQSAVRLAHGTTGVELAPGVVLATSQPNRQVISRWVAAAKKAGTQQASPYLTQAAGQISATSPLVLALDLSECVTAPAARTFLATQESLKNKIAEQADLAELFASVKGATLAVSFGDHRAGTLRVDFGKPAADLKPYAKDLLGAVMDEVGASLDDFDNWSITVAGTSVTWTGEISTVGLRKIISLIAPGSGHRDLGTEEPSPSAATSPEATKAATSQKFFRSVKGLIDELHQTLNKTRDNHAVWFERYARKIDDLPIKDVDKDLLTFGGNVSNSFRYQAQAKRMAGVRTGVREAQPNYQTSYGYNSVGPYGTYGTYSWSTTVRAEPERGQIRAEENATATQVRISEWKQIEDGMVQVRRVLTERYNVEF